MSGAEVRRAGCGCLRVGGVVWARGEGAVGGCQVHERGRGARGRVWVARGCGCLRVGVVGFLCSSLCVSVSLLTHRCLTTCCSAARCCACACLHPLPLYYRQALDCLLQRCTVLCNLALLSSHTLSSPPPPSSPLHCQVLDYLLQRCTVLPNLVLLSRHMLCLRLSSPPPPPTYLLPGAGLPAASLHGASLITHAVPVPVFHPLPLCISRRWTTCCSAALCCRTWCCWM